MFIVKFNWRDINNNRKRQFNGNLMSEKKINQMNNARAFHIRNKKKTKIE